MSSRLRNRPVAKTKPKRRTGGTAQPPTFQGRKIVTIKWKGKVIEAVEGLTAYRRETRVPIAREDAERGLNAAVAHTTEIDDLGIGVMMTDVTLSAERASSFFSNIAADVLWSEPVFLDRGSMTPNDPLFPDQWGLKEIEAEAGWDLVDGDVNQVVLAILDSGISIEGGELSHPDLDEPDRFSLGRDLVNKDDDPSDDHGHGTHVAGIVAATRNNNTGVAGLWPGPILVIKVFNSNNDGSSLTFKDGIAAAVKFASDAGLRLVINYSGGGPDGNVKRTAVKHAIDNGALLVAAAGNGFGGPLDFPAAYSSEFAEVVAVGAVDRDRTHPDFGSIGVEMTVVAPGVDILSTLPNYFVTINDEEGKQIKYDRLQGTSQATPLVAALAALIWAKNPAFAAADVRNKLADTADPIAGSQEEFGSGIINAKRALT